MRVRVRGSERGRQIVFSVHVCPYQHREGGRKRGSERERQTDREVEYVRDIDCECASACLNPKLEILTKP